MYKSTYQVNIGKNSKIEWRHHTFNAWSGCDRISPGCDNCYAGRIEKRFPGRFGTWGQHGKRVVTSDAYWKRPLRWNAEARETGERKRVLVNSLSDVFEDREDLVGPRRRLGDLIEDCPDLDWLLLTKRPRSSWLLLSVMFRLGQSRILPRNVWVGVTCEDGGVQAMDRMRFSQDIWWYDSYVTFVSFEPLLGPIRLPPINYMASIEWAIIGGESGPKARPFHLEWCQNLIAQLRARGTKVFVKQLGANPVECDASMKLRDRKGADIDEWPEDLRIREIPNEFA